MFSYKVLYENIMNYGVHTMPILKMRKLTQKDYQFSEDNAVYTDSTRTQNMSLPTSAHPKTEMHTLYGES